MPPNAQPKVLMMGPAAVSATSKIMLSAKPMRVNSSFGIVDLIPGSVWQQNRVLIDCSDMTVHYMVGALLYEANTQQFIRDAWVSGLILGASQAQWLVHLAKLEREFLMGLLVPISAILGLHCAQLVVVYANHREAFKVLQTELPSIIRDAKIVRRENPTLSRKVLDQVSGELMANLPEGIAIEDVAFWLGRILKGSAALPDLKAAGLTKVLAVVTVLVGLSHSPGMAVRGTTEAIVQTDIEAKLKELQLHLNQPDTVVIAREMSQAKESKEALKRLQSSLTKALPNVKEVFEAWEKASG